MSKRSLEQLLSLIVRQQLDEIVTLQSDAVEPLIAFLRDPAYNGISKEVLIVLDRIGDTRAVEPIITTQLPKHRPYTAVDVLGLLGDARAVEPLLNHPDNKDDFFFQQTLDAVGNIGDARAVEPILEILQQSGSSFRLREKAVEALGKIGDARAVDPLASCLEDKDAAVRGAAILALAHLGDVRVVTALLDLLGQEQKKNLAACVTALTALLKSSASRMDADNLAICAELKDYEIKEQDKYVVTDEYEDEDQYGRHTVTQGFWMYKVVQTIDCHSIRELAKKELDRRN
ncbi:MAG: HEAT repeat domain-containing protein [Anaerolineae bacterium]|nr:HEAT repeat domain-containing protein [Anaerolineae bacterium]